MPLSAKWKGSRSPGTEFKGIDSRLFPKLGSIGTPHSFFKTQNRETLSKWSPTLFKGHKGQSLGSFSNLERLLETLLAIKGGQYKVRCSVYLASACGMWEQ